MGKGSAVIQCHMSPRWRSASRTGPSRNHGLWPATIRSPSLQF